MYLIEIFEYRKNERESIFSLKLSIISSIETQLSKYVQISLEKKVIARSLRDVLKFYYIEIIN